jgi:hypothetical protein
MSAMEHLVPEQMFSTEEAPANGISAVKAIQLAAAEGQKIYTITQQNLSIALQQLQLSSEIKADIRNAVNAGMEVTTHQHPVNFFGSQSVGYILLDPNTGAGAYRVSGGENGSEVDSQWEASMAMLGTAASDYAEEIILLGSIMAAKFANWAIPAIEKINCIINAIVNVSDKIALLLAVTIGVKAKKTARRLMKKFGTAYYAVLVGLSTVVAVEVADCFLGKNKEINMKFLFRLMASFLGMVLVYISPMAIYRDYIGADPSLSLILKMHLVFIMGVLFLYSGFAGVNLFTWGSEK